MYKMHNKKFNKFSDLNRDQKVAFWILTLMYPVVIIGSIISTCRPVKNKSDQSTKPTTAQVDTMYVVNATFRRDEPVKFVKMINQNGQTKTSSENMDGIGYWAKENDTVFVQDGKIVGISWHQRMREKFTKQH